MIITFTRNVFIPLTNICRNNCGYCGFKRDMTHPEAKLMTPNEVEAVLLRGVKSGCCEALFTFGEKPEEVEGFDKMLYKLGYYNIIDYLRDLCKLSIKIGLMPHSNAGVLEKDELEKLKPYNASMGLMLETSANVEAHKGCKGKEPSIRIKTIEYAGELKIPFTTGILIGIGETFNDRVESLEIIKKLHKKYGHIQEVIIQNFTPKQNSKMKPPKKEEIKEIVIIARKILQNDISIQVAPNLINPIELVKCGASDIGGISSETIDYINPESPWPEISKLKAEINLRERLPIYPQYIKKKWYSKEISELIENYSDSDGFRKSYELV